jgi:hypothetical protein
MSSAVPILKQILIVTGGLALIGGVAGVLIGKFAASASLSKSAGIGMIIAGTIVGFLAGNSGSPTGRRGGAWAQRSSVPQTGYQYVVGALLTFGLGIAILVLA